MTNDEFRNAAYDMIYLIACTVNGTEPDKKRVSEMDTAKLYSAAKKHSLRAITADALERAGVTTPEFKEAKMKAVRRDVLFDKEREAILHDFERAGIWYMPLKGSVLKKYYPKSFMREMSDNDILADPDKLKQIREIMQKQGYKSQGELESGHDVEYFKKPIFNFEIHHRLFEDSVSETFKDYYSDIQSLLLNDETTRFGRRFSKEEFYIYMCTHEYKHYINSGTGIRSLLDAYVFMHTFGDTLDRGYIAAAAEKLGIAAYEKESRALAEKVFSLAELDKSERRLLDFYIFSGTYGTLENKMQRRISKNGGGTRGKMKYFLNRVFLTPQALKELYPFVYRHKILLPFLFFYRIGRSLTVSRELCFSELKNLLQKNKKNK